MYSHFSTIFPKHEIVRAKLIFDLKGRRAGVAHVPRGNPATWQTQPIVRLNEELLTNPDYFDRLLNKTLPHEICHIVQYQVFPGSKPHGWEWQRLMISLGLEPHRTHDMPVTPAKIHRRPFIYTCACEGKEFTLTRRLHEKVRNKAQRRYCPICRHTLIFSHIDSER